MRLYLSLISLSALLITLWNHLLATPVAAQGVLPLLLLVAGEVAAVILLDGAEAFFIRRLPARWFAPNAPAFRVSRREYRLWRALGVRLWCDKIPELGGFSGFHKDRVREPRSKAYLERFLLECNYGVVIHLTNAVSGFLLLALFPQVTLTVALPVACVNLVLSLMPLGALRYNTHGLLSLYRRVKAREK